MHDRILTWGRIRVAVAGLFFLAAFFASVSSARAQTDYREIEKARDEYLAARKKEADAKAKILPKREAEQDIAAKMLAQLQTNVTAYEAVEAEYSALRGAILKKYEERRAIIVVPAGLLDEYTEYKRRYEILKDEKYYPYVDKVFFRSVQDRISDLQKQIKTAHDEADQKEKTINAEIAALQASKKDIDNRAEAVLALPMDKSLFDQWLTAAIETDKVRQVALRAETDMNKAFEAYSKALLKTSPPYLKAVTVTGGGQKVYVAQWQPKSPKVAGSTQNELDVENNRLRLMLPHLQRAVVEMENDLREHAATRLKLAEDMKVFSTKMEEAAKDEGNAAVDKILAQIAIESVGVVVEVALTGGAATVARKASEIAAEEAAKKTIVKKAISKADAKAMKANPLSVRELKNLNDPHLLENFAREMAEIDRRIVEREAKLVQERIAAATKRGRAEAVEAARHAQGEVAARQVGKDIDKYTVAVSRDMKTAHLNALEQSDIAFHNALTEWGNDKAMGAFAKLSAAGTMAAFGQQTAEALEYLKMPPVSSDVTAVVMSDGIELALARGMKYAALQGAESLEVAAGKIAPDATRWQKITTGGKALLGSNLNYKHFKEAFKPDLSFAITAATTIGKAAATAYYLGKEQAAHARFIAAYTELDVRYEMYSISLAADRQVWQLQQDYHQQIAQALGRLAEMGKPRELKISTNEMLPPPGASLKIEVQFSTFLSQSPVVKLADEAVSMKPLGQPETSDRWEGTIELRKIVPDASTAPLVVALNKNDKPFAKLDGNPQTPAHLESIAGDLWADDVWKEYEAGTDTNHQLLCLNLGGKWSAKGYEDGPEEVLIYHKGKDVTATKLTGSTFLAKDQITWQGTMNDNPFSGKVQIAKGGGRDAKWLNGKITVKDKDHLTVEDEEGWIATFTRLKK